MWFWNRPVEANSSAEKKADQHLRWATPVEPSPERARRMAREAAAEGPLAELREDELGPKRAQTFARDLGAFAAIGLGTRVWRFLAHWG